MNDKRAANVQRLAAIVSVRVQARKKNILLEIPKMEFLL